MGSGDFADNLVSMRYDHRLQSNYLDLTFPGVTLLESDLRMKQGLALTILGKLRNSRLFRLLRYQRGLVYDVKAGASLFPGLGYVYITSEVSSERLFEVVSLIVAELGNFVKSGPTEEELRFAKNFLTNQWLMAFDHPSSIAGWIESDLLWKDKIDLPEETIKEVEGIKISDITEVMQKHWDFSKLNLVVQGPVRNSLENVKKLTEILEELR